MKTRHEIRYYGSNEKVWVGKYKNSQNLLHWHHDCELIYVEKGTLNVMCNKNLYTITSGQALFIDSEQLHYISALSEECLLITFFFTQDIKNSALQNVALVNPVLSSAYHIPEIYVKVKDELQKKRDFYTFYTANLITELMINIFRGEAICQSPRKKPTTDSFKKLLDKINVNYEFMTFEEAASFMGMNPAYFSRFFHNLTGMPFSVYLNYIKVAKAIELLHSDDSSVSEVAIACGFSTIRNFNRVFKKFTGFAPTDIPKDFILDEAYTRSISAFGNPTLGGCELIESSRDVI